MPAIQRGDRLRISRDLLDWVSARPAAVLEVGGHHPGRQWRESARAPMAAPARRRGAWPPGRRSPSRRARWPRPEGPPAVPRGPGPVHGPQGRREGAGVIVFPTTPASFLLPTCLLCGTRDAEGTWAVLVERVDAPSPGRFSVPCRATEHRTFCPSCAARYPDPLGEWKRRQGAAR